MLKIKTEIYSRVSGYYRPVSQYNLGKQEEYHERRTLKYGLRDGEVLDKSEGNRGAIHNDLNVQSPIGSAIHRAI